MNYCADCLFENGQMLLPPDHGKLMSMDDLPNPLPEDWMKLVAPRVLFKFMMDHDLIGTLDYYRACYRVYGDAFKKLCKCYANNETQLSDDEESDEFAWIDNVPFEELYALIHN